MAASSKGITFYQFISKKVSQDDIIGDLAGDIMREPDAPKGSSSFQRWKLYLQIKGACAGALEALAEAWKEYRTVYPRG